MNSLTLLNLLAFLSLLAQPVVADDKLPRVAETFEIDGNKVMVRLTGACMFCKLSSATLEGIQAKIVERLGELVRLIPVAGAAKARH